MFAYFMLSINEFAFVLAGLENNFAMALRRSCHARDECLGS